MEQIVGELVNGAKAVILSIYEDNTGIKEKLDDLDSLVFKIGGTVKLTNKIKIKRNKPLRALRMKLKRTVKHGEDVLREFKNRTNQTGLGNQEGSSSSSSSSAQKITRQIKRWTRAYEDVKRLNETIRMLKKADVDAKDFHELLKREMSMQADRAIIERFRRQNHDPDIAVLYRKRASFADSGGELCGQSASFVASGGELCGQSVSFAAAGGVWGQSEEEESEVALNLWGLSEEEQQNEGEEETPQHLLWERNIEERNYKNKIDRMGDLVTRLSILIEAAKRESNDSPWLIPRLAKMTEAVTQGKTALETIKNIPWFIHRCDNLAQRLERMIEDLKYLSELQVLIEAEYTTNLIKLIKTKLEKAGIIGRVHLNVLGLPLRPEEKECAYYLRTGQCKFGNTCKFHHPPSNAMIALRSSGGAAYASPQAVTSPVYAARPGFIASPRWQGPSSYAQVILPQGMMQVPTAWNTYPAQMGSSSPDDQQRSNTATYYTTSRQSELPSDQQNMYQSYQPGSVVYAMQRENVFPERPDQPECQFYMKTGDCKFGATCKFHHPRERLVPAPNCALSPIGLPLRPGEPVCDFYSRYGICKFGPNCKFDHPMGGTYMYGHTASPQQISVGDRNNEIEPSQSSS